MEIPKKEGGKAFLRLISLRDYCVDVIGTRLSYPRLLKPAARTASLSFIPIHVIFFILSYLNQIHTKKTKAQNSRLSAASER